MLRCLCLPRSGAQVQLGPVRQQEVPRPGEDCAEQQARRPDPGTAAGLEGGHGPRRRLLRRPRGVRHRLVRVGADGGPSSQPGGAGSVEALQEPVSGDGPGRQDGIQPHGLSTPSCLAPENVCGGRVSGCIRVRTDLYPHLEPRVIVIG